MTSRHYNFIAMYYTGCPTRYRTRHFFNTFTTNEDIATKFDTYYRHTLQTRATDTRYRHTLQTRATDTHYRHTLQTRATDTSLFISHTTNVLLFKFRCNIFFGVIIIKEMPGSVASRTPVVILIYGSLFNLMTAIYRRIV